MKICCFTTGAKAHAGKLYEAGRECFTKGQDHEAWEYLSLATHLDPQNLHAWLFLALTCDALGDARAARFHLLTMVSVNEQDPDGWANLGLHYSHHGRHFEAAGAFAKAVRLSPSNACYWSDLGRALLNNGRPDRAIPALTCAIALAPADDHAWQLLAEAYRQARRLDPNKRRFVFQAWAGDGPIGGHTRWVSETHQALGIGHAT
jgi:Flp pilus assembly protein TadD